MKKQMLTAMLIASLLLSGCGQAGEASPSSSNLPEASRSSVVDNIPEEVFDEGDLNQIGQRSVEKWETIGHIFSEPLYNTNFLQLGQDELRKIYSVYIYYNNLDATLVSERSTENGVVHFWMDLDQFREFIENYFGLHVDDQENNLPESCIVGDEIQFYFNSRFNVLPSELSEFNLINCTQNPDKTFTALVKVKQFDEPNMETLIQEFDLSLSFMIKDDTIIFLSAYLS